MAARTVAGIGGLPAHSRPGRLHLARHRQPGPAVCDLLAAARRGRHTIPHGVPSRHRAMADHPRHEPGTARHRQPTRTRVPDRPERVWHGGRRGQTGQRRPGLRGLTCTDTARQRRQQSGVFTTLYQRCKNKDIPAEGGRRESKMTRGCRRRRSTFTATVLAIGLVATGIGYPTASAATSSATLTEPTGVTVAVHPDGSYLISKAAPLQVWSFGGTIAHPLTDVTVTGGHDSLGGYREIDFRYRATGDRRGGIRTYTGSPVVLFTTTYLTAAPNTE